MSNRRLLPLAAAMIAGLGYVSSAQALFEDNDARIAINAMRKDMVTMQAQISRLENGQKASLALSDLFPFLLYPRCEKMLWAF